MDTLTQAALGAAVGLAGWRRLGRRSLLFGAFCGLLPDLDVVLGMGPGGDWRGLLTHRGSSHSLLVLPLVALPVGWLGWRLGGRRGTAASWVHLAFWALVTHPLLDAFTTYGTQLLAPLSRHRFSWDGVAIIDPLPTLPLVVAVILGLRAAAGAGTVRFARGALAWMLAYCLAGAGVSAVARAEARELLAARGFEPVALRTPVPLVYTPLRRVAARDAAGNLVVGVLPPWAPERARLVELPAPQDPRVQQVLATERGQLLAWFSDGYLSAEERDGELWILDQRYGLYDDPTWTPFRARLPAGAPVEALELDRGRGGMDGRAELAAGWALMWGP